MNLFLFLPRKASQWLVFLVSILASVGVTFFLSAFVCSFSQMSVMFQLANDWHLSDSLLYSTVSQFSLSEEEKLAEHKRILSTDGVLDVNNVSYYAFTFPFIGTTANVICINYSDSLLKDIRYVLVEGTYPSKNQKNQILLPAYYSKVYKVGDTLRGYDNTSPSISGPFANYKPISVTVAGFFAEQPTLDPWNGGGLIDIFSRHISFFYDKDVTDGIAFNMCDEDGSVLPSVHTDFFLIRTHGSIPTDKVKENLSVVVESPALLHTGNELIEEYIDENKEEIGETISLGITALILAFSILISSTLLELVYRKKEMATLYLCGAPWSKCLWTVLATYILPFVIGFPIGLFLFAESSETTLFYILKPKLEISDVLVTLGLQVLFLAIAILPFRFSAKFKTPYELFRKD
jgi:hypothetical protein